ncbi:MAG: hypothetical protein ABSE72_12440, partial [Bacteroidales bacterium]
PEGKTAIQENQKGKIIINLKDKPKGYIMDRVKTFEDACIESGIFPEDIYHSSDTSDEIAYKQLKLIAKVLRGEWEPNWNDENEKKWYPWFQWSSGSGFDFSSSYYGYGNTYTSVGSRLCFPKKELAEYFGKQFIEIHRELLTIKK